MSLDLSPTPETTRDISQTSSSPPAPDSLEALSQRSGISATTLGRLNPDEMSGLQRLEDDVVRATETPGSLTPDALRAVTEARDQVRAGISQRFEAPDLSGTELADARVQVEMPTTGGNRRVAPEDATLRIEGQIVTIQSRIHLYGDGATQDIANTFERQIQAEWGQNPRTGQPWTYTDPESGKVFEVKFDVDVDLYDKENPGNAPGLFSGRNNPFNRENYIEVTTERERSNVRGGDEGHWRGDGRRGRVLADDNPAAHEFGHLLGLPDRYVKRGPDEGKPVPGWEGNIMAMRAGRGVVEQRDIDTIARSHVGRAVLLEKMGGGGVYTGEINP